jgi:hypothetical protein
MLNLWRLYYPSPTRRGIRAGPRLFVSQRESTRQGYGRNHQHRHLLGFYIAIIDGYGISKNFDLLSIFFI